MQLIGSGIDLLRRGCNFFIAGSQVAQAFIDIKCDFPQLFDFCCDKVEHCADLIFVAIAFACSFLRGLAERTHFIGHDCKAFACRTRARCFDRSIQCKQVGIARNPFNAVVILFQRTQ